MVDAVAKTLCHKAGTSVQPVCGVCEITNGQRICTMWPLFRDEAEAAITTAYRWHKKHRRWPGFVKRHSGEGE